MNLLERYKDFPVKFYKNLTTGMVEYESGFTKGKAKTLNDAFKEFSRKDFYRDMYYYYDDVVDVQFGNFEPSTNDKIINGRIFLGKLNLKLDLIDYRYSDKEHTVKYLSKNRDEITNHINYINNLKYGKRGIDRFMHKIKNRKIAEMFNPVKATMQLTCKHCGKMIPLASYYEEYKKNSYHIECIWDLLINNIEENSYEDSRKFFFDLSKYVGNWPGYGFDIEEDYLSDLELVKHNDRITKGSIAECLICENTIIERYLNEKII